MEKQNITAVGACWGGGHLPHGGEEAEREVTGTRHNLQRLAPEIYFLKQGPIS
jgi:hypothetical protein